MRRDFVLVMQRGAAHDHAADRHRLQIGNGRQRACAPNLDDDFLEPCRRLLRREFMRDGPTRRAADETKPFLPIEPVEFVDHAVDIEGQRVAFCVDLAVIGEQFFGVFAQLRGFVERETPMFDLLRISCCDLK